MNVEKFTGPGTTPARQRFWDSIADIVSSLTKQEGKNVTVQEFPGEGTIIDVDRKQGAVTPNCPTNIILSFSEVIFDCGCVSQDEGNTTSQIVSEGTVNSDTATLTKGSNANCLDQPCVWIWESFIMHTGIEVWGSSNDCTGSSSILTSIIFGSLVLDSLSGLYHLFAYSVTGLAAIFYGTTTDLSLPIANTLSCSATYMEFDNPAVTCIFGGPTNLTVVAHGGTASLAF